MTGLDVVGIVGSAVSVVSLFGNVLQYLRKRERDKVLRRLSMEHYNNFFYIARSLTRVRNCENNSEDKDVAAQINGECNYIRGIADSARISLMEFAKQELKYDVKFVHPAYPDRETFSDEVIMGLPPEEEKKHVFTNRDAEPSIVTAEMPVLNNGN